jgi:2-oxoglutarate ferredoxin oxidoreductase subunit beta
MHDGSILRIKKLGREYDPTNKFDALKVMDEAERKGEVLTGVFYVDTGKPNFMEMLNMEEAPLSTLPESKVRPPKDVLDQVMEELR